jgi:integrase
VISARRIRPVRIVTAPAELADVLRAQAGDRSKTEPLFTALRGGRLRNSTFHTTVWQPALDKAQTQGLGYRPRVHDLRAAAVTWLIEGGVPIDVVADQMGHESVTTTFNIYRRVNPESGRLAAAAMSAMLATAVRPVLGNDESPAQPEG